MLYWSKQERYELIRVGTRTQRPRMSTLHAAESKRKAPDDEGDRSDDAAFCHQ